MSRDPAVPGAGSSASNLEQDESRGTKQEEQTHQATVTPPLRAAGPSSSRSLPPRMVIYKSSALAKTAPHLANKTYNSECIIAAQEQAEDVRIRFKAGQVDDKGVPIVQGEGQAADAQRHNRRVVLNRRSAAASRVRKEAYVSALEAQLARLEEHYNNLVGMLQNMEHPTGAPILTDSSPAGESSTMWPPAELPKAAPERDANPTTEVIQPQQEDLTGQLPLGVAAKDLPADFGVLPDLRSVPTQLPVDSQQAGQVNAPQNDALLDGDLDGSNVGAANTSDSHIPHTVEPEMKEEPECMSAVPIHPSTIAPNTSVRSVPLDTANADWNASENGADVPTNDIPQLPLLDEDLREFDPAFVEALLNTIAAKGTDTNCGTKDGNDDSALVDHSFARYLNFED